MTVLGTLQSITLAHQPTSTIACSHTGCYGPGTEKHRDTCGKAFLKVDAQCQADAYMHGQVMRQENVQAGRVEGCQLQAPGGLDVCIDVHEREQEEDAPYQKVMPCTVKASSCTQVSISSGPLTPLSVTDTKGRTRRPGTRGNMVPHVSPFLLF